MACRLNTHTNGVTFGQLKPHLVNLLINALQIENDNCNTHLLLGEFSEYYFSYFKITP